MTIGSGTDRIDLYYFGRGHTNGDAWVVFPALRVVHAGDIFARQEPPAPRRQQRRQRRRDPGHADRRRSSARQAGVDTIITGHSTVDDAGRSAEYADFNRDFLNAVPRRKKRPARPWTRSRRRWTMPAKYAGYAAPTAGAAPVERRRSCTTRLRRRHADETSDRSRRAHCGRRRGCRVSAGAGSAAGGAAGADESSRSRSSRTTCSCCAAAAATRTVFVQTNGVTVVDTKNPGWGQPLLDKIKELTPKPVTTIINTHTHGDHVSGNVEFPATVDIVDAREHRGQHEADAAGDRHPSPARRPVRTSSSRTAAAACRSGRSGTR